MDCESVKEKLSNLLQQKKLLYERDSGKDVVVKVEQSNSVTVKQEEVAATVEDKFGGKSEFSPESAVSTEEKIVDEPVDYFSSISLHDILNEKKLALLQHKDVLEILKKQQK